MNILMIMIPVTLLLSSCFAFAFMWASKNGQWDDLDLAPRRSMLDSRPTSVSEESAESDFLK